MIPRRGTTLIELLVVISGCSAILSTSAALIYRAMQTHAQTQVFLRGEREMSRLAGDFRRDIHTAFVARATSTDEHSNAGLSLHSADQKHLVTYRTTGARLVRIETLTDRPTRRSFYLLPTRSRVEFTQGPTDRHWTLLVWLPSGRDGPAGRDARAIMMGPPSLRVVARLGRYQRVVDPPSIEGLLQ